MPRTRKAPPSLIPPLSLLLLHTSLLLLHRMHTNSSSPSLPATQHPRRSKTNRKKKKTRSDCITFHIINIVVSILLIELKVLTSWPQPDCLVSIAVPPETNSIRSAFYCSQNTCPFPSMAVFLPTLFPLFRSLSPLLCLENSYCPSP